MEKEQKLKEGNETKKPKLENESEDVVDESGTANNTKTDEESDPQQSSSSLVQFPTNSQNLVSTSSLYYQHRMDTGSTWSSGMATYGTYNSNTSTDPSVTIPTNPAYDSSGSHYPATTNSDGTNYLFQSFPESLPDDFGNIDFSTQSSTSIDYNVSGNYAWLFGREFWSDIYPKGASYAYELLTEGGNNSFAGGQSHQQPPPYVSSTSAIELGSRPNGHNNNHNISQPHSSMVKSLRGTNNGMTAASSVDSTSHNPTNPLGPPPSDSPSNDNNNNITSDEIPDNYASKFTNDTDTNTPGNNNERAPALSDGTYQIDSSQGPSQLPFIRPDYLGSRIELNANLLYEYTVKNQDLSINGKYPTNEHANDVKIGPRYPLGKSVMNATQTVYTKDRKGGHKSGGIGQHVFGKTYGHFQSAKSKTALMENHVYLDEEAQKQIMNILPNTTTDSLYFTPESLSRYLDLYWSNFDPIYPMIHKPTFKATEARPELLICMIVVGMAYSNDSGSYDLAVTILQRVRIAMLSMIDETPQVPIWVLQGLLLINYFVNVFGSRQLIEMSQVFHGTHIALLRLSKYLSDLVIPEIPEDYNTIDVDAFWKYYIDFEAKKRTTFFAFICDTQQAVFYRHTLGLSAFEVHLELPCSDACWEANTSKSFIEIYRVQPRHLQPRPYPDLEEMFNPYSKNRHSEESKNQTQDGINSSKQSNDDSRKDHENDPLMEELPIKTQGNWPTFLFSIRRLMSPYYENQYEYALECFSPYSRFILLHGLLNISWEMQWRGFLDMGIVSKRRMHEFKTRLVVAFTSWKGYFDRQLRKLNTPELNRIVCGDMISASSSCASSPDQESDENGRPVLQLNSYSNTLILCSNWGLYHLGLIVLYVDTLMIRKFAELPRNTGEDSYNGGQIKMDSHRSKQYVNRWVSTLDAKWATWHSMHFLKRIFNNELLIHQADCLPWCTFVATLTLWAYDRDKEGNESKVISSKAYFEYSSEGTKGAHVEANTGGGRLSDLVINKAVAQKDALEYLELIKNSPPKTLNGSSPREHDISTPSDPVKRSELVIAVIAYGYLLLQRFDRSSGNYLQTLQGILERYK